MLKRLDDSISIIDTEALGRSGVVAAYVVTGKERALVDMGYASSAGVVLKDIVNEFGNDPIDYLLPTHVHLDHSGACGALARTFDTASIRVHPKGFRHLIDPSRLWESVKALFGESLADKYAKPESIEQPRVSTIQDGDEIKLGRDLTLRCHWTPGHASHHSSYELEGKSVIFTGDAVGITYPQLPVLIPTTPPTSFDLKLAIESLEKLRNVSPKVLYTPHFGVTGDAMSFIKLNIRSLKDWVSKIEIARKRGMSAEMILDKLTADLADSGATKLNAVPEYVRTSVRVSVLGVMRYLSLLEQAGACESMHFW